MKTVVIYKSKTGFAKKYAEWIAEALAADIFEASSVAIDKIKNYDTVIYGGGLYIAGISGVKMITQHLDKLKGKKIVVFATGLSQARDDSMKGIVNKNFTPEQLKQVKFFYLRGGFDLNKHNLFYRGLMALMQWKLKRKKTITSDEQGILAACKTPVDFTDKKNINDLVTYARGN
jgi:menaquinone-dependent protoporphyrinogen IX oxidase